MELKEVQYILDVYKRQEQVGALHCEIAESPDILMLCTCAADFEEAARSKKLGVLMSFEGAEPVSSLTLLHSFYAAGVRGLGPVSYTHLDKRGK